MPRSSHIFIIIITCGFHMTSGNECGLQMRVRMIVKGETQSKCSNFVVFTAVPANETDGWRVEEGQMASSSYES